MAPSRKRTRNDDDDDVEGGVEIESASSSLRSNTNKRSRVAMAQARGGSTVSDDEDETQDLDQLMNGFGYDNDDSEMQFHHESEDEEISDLKASQIVQKQITAARGDNVASEYGIIEEVQCKNFMCHGNLRIKLGPLINFIIGHNGSGKSAVLTALQMCLGGKASATNRGANLKAMIKEGQETASLSVKIKNDGDGAYKPTLYGSSITVERSFSRSGGSAWKIKNEAEKIVSNKRSDLDDILDYFAFQLDNPINVLTQDMARQFLSNSTPADKYKFFIKGTQLDVLDGDYNVMEENVDSAEAKLRNREEDVQVKRQRAEEAERKKKRLDASRGIQDKIEATQRQHAWAQVEEQEAMLAQYEEGIQEWEQKVQDATEEAENVSGHFEGHNQSFEAAERNLEEASTQLEPLQQEHADEKSNFDANVRELRQNTADERNIRAEVKLQKDAKKRLDRQIAEEQARLEEAEGPAHGQRLEQLGELKEAAEQAEQAEKDHRATLAPLEKNRVDAEQAVNSAEKPIERQSAELRSSEGTVSRLQKEQGSPFSSYRPNMAQLVRAVNNETRWRKKPVGPVGDHVRLLKPEWSSVIERTFGGQLESFIVTGKEDQRLLQDIMGRINCKPPIFIGNDNHLDTRGKEPDDEELDTILRVLQIDNEMVRNQFIINQAIEQVVLIRDMNQAQDFMYSTPPPRNVKVTIALNESRHGYGIRYEFSRSRAKKSSPVPPWEGAARMETDHAEQLRTAKENVSHNKRELDTLQQQYKVLRREHTVSEQAIERWKKTGNALRGQKQKAHDDVEAMEAEIENNRPQDGKLQELQNQLQTTEADIVAAQASFGDCITAKENLGSKGRDLMERADAALEKLNACKGRIDKAERRKAQLEGDRQAALRAKNEALNRIEAMKRHLADSVAKRDHQKETLQRDFVANAEKVCLRINIEPGMTPNLLDQRLDKFIKEYERAQREAGGTREELTEAWKEARRELKEILDEQAHTIRLAKTLKASLTERRYRWQKFLQFIAYRARFTFSYLLSERQFRGRVVMDHEGKELDIKVEPDMTKSTDAGRKTQTLSGGEKSFSTICLLLSIWEAMGSPIRCLDEFDVFMDNVNRSTSMTMMIQAARRSVGRQFILITPQSMANVQLGPDVSIHKMSDPERGQTTLPFAA